jgi:hypothetical protein
MAQRGSVPASVVAAPATSSVPRQASVTRLAATNLLPPKDFRAREQAAGGGLGGHNLCARTSN